MLDGLVKVDEEGVWGVVNRKAEIQGRKRSGKTRGTRSEGN
jgi:hypothetical protein